MRLHVLAASVLAAALSLTACQHVQTSPPAAQADVASTAAAGADDNLNAVLWVQTSAEYRALGEQAFRAAAAQLDRALAEKDWDALVPGERANPGTGLPPAVVMDIDETVLDNSPYQARLVRNGTQYDEVTWSDWVNERSAAAVPGVVDFARAATARGITIVYISNRAQHLDVATIANLRSVGMPVKDAGAFLGLGTHVDGCEQHGSEKNCRREQVGRDYRVLMQFGDQLGDFVQVLSNTADGRAALLDAHGRWFGERWWMLPNPTYGSWEPAAFNNDWSQPREVRRAAKRAALDVAP